MDKELNVWVAKSQFQLTTKPEDTTTTNKCCMRCQYVKQIKDGSPIKAVPLLALNLPGESLKTGKKSLKSRECRRVWG